ncbi:hypothetical protein EON66_01430, partial [archaeon]
MTDRPPAGERAARDSSLYARAAGRAARLTAPPPRCPCISTRALRRNMSYFCNTSLTRAMYYGTKIVAIGKNYGAHIVEMGGSTAARAPRPLYFLKPSSSVIAAGGAGGCAPSHFHN